MKRQSSGILSHSGELSAKETLRKLQENVVGIDIHPVAVQLAKATWVMAAADTIRAARTEGTGTGAVSAPIYLGDSMQLRYDTGTLYASQSIELETHETLPGHTGAIIFSIPKELARQQAGHGPANLRNRDSYRRRAGLRARR